MASCTWTAFAYQYGWGTDRDVLQSANLFEKACDGGELSACRSPGYLYRNGLGVELDETKALSFYHKACDGGDKGACADTKVEP
jgi:TPR repeat protein